MLSSAYNYLADKPSGPGSIALAVLVFAKAWKILPRLGTQLSSLKPSQFEPRLGIQQFHRVLAVSAMAGIGILLFSTVSSERYR